MATSSMSRLRWSIFFAGVLAMFVGPIHLEPARVRKLPSLISTKPAIQGVGEFVSNGVYMTTDSRALPKGLQTRGSWLGSDDFQGSYLTDWFKAQPEITLMVSGYPALYSNRLEVEIRRNNGSISTLAFKGANPTESWQPWTIKLPSDAAALRIRAVDASSKICGWLAFSEPFVPAVWSLRDLWPFVQLVTATSLAITLLYGPGLVWFLRRPRAVSDLALAAFIGPILLSIVGIVCWVCGGWSNPAIIARVAVSLIFAMVAIVSWFRRKQASTLPGEVSTIIGLSLLLVGFSVAKANLSYAAPGELFHGTIARTLEVGGHSDSRIPYQVVQLVANHFTPYGPKSTEYFYPWSFANRGPLAGLLAAPLVLATGAHVPAEAPSQDWRPFDPQGYAVYRIALIVLASLAGWAVFGVSAAIMDSTWALLTASIVFLAPFFVHEMYFTWPKLMAASGVMASFLLIKKSRPLAAGAILGLGYLFHPSAILAAPFLGIWILGLTPPIPWTARLSRGILFGAGVSIFVVFWLAVGSFRPGKAVGQDIFLQYFLIADNHPATWHTWWQTRLDNIANTFIPFRLLFTDQTHESINSVYGISNDWVHFGFLYWNTLPFALGLLSFVALAPALAAACWRTPRIALTTFVGPAVFLAVYWGCACTGMMRHCGHWLFLSSILLAVWSVRKSDAPWRIWAIVALTSPFLLALRGLDIAWMAFGAVLHDHWPDLGVPFGVNDWISLAIAAVFLSGAVMWLGRILKIVRKRLLATPSDPNAARANLGSLVGSWIDRNSKASILLTLAACVAILATRRPDLWRTPQFWAEDAYFYQWAYLRGWHALFIPYAGYLHFMPRVIAALVVQTDPRWAPAFFVGIAIALTVYVSARTLSARCPLRPQIACALAVVLIPDSQEVLCNVVNLQWILAGALFLVLISSDAHRWWQHLHDVAAAISIGLTGPFSILLAPLFAWRAWRRRSASSLVLAGLIAICGAVQAYVILNNPQSPATPSIAYDLIFPAIGKRLAGTLLMGPFLPNILNPKIATILGIASLAGIAALALGSRTRRTLHVALGVTFGVLLAGSLYRCRFVLTDLCYSGAWGARYFFPLELIIIWLLLDAAFNRRHAGYLVWILAWILLINAPSLRLRPFPNLHWNDYSPKIRAGTGVTVPVNPGWSFTFPPRGSQVGN